MMDIGSVYSAMTRFLMMRSVGARTATRSIPSTLQEGTRMLSDLLTEHDIADINRLKQRIAEAQEQIQRIIISKIPSDAIICLIDTYEEWEKRNLVPEDDSHRNSAFLSYLQNRLEGFK